MKGHSLFVWSKSQEETKALNNSKAGVSNPPTVPEHKGTDLVNENAADDNLFEMIEKESAELMEPIKNWECNIFCLPKSFS